MDGAGAPTQWSRNWLVFNVRGKSGTQDIWIAPVDGKSPPRPYLETEFDEAAGRLSPDERWMAYQSNMSDQTHIYVSPFPNARGDRWPVSGRDGGGGPAWREDGGEISTGRSGGAGKMMAVPVTVKGNSFEMGTARELFTRESGWQTGITRDGQRFLLPRPPEDMKDDAPLVVVVNWMSLLAKK